MSEDNYALACEAEVTAANLVVAIWKAGDFRSACRVMYQSSAYLF